MPAPAMPACCTRHGPGRCAVRGDVRSPSVSPLVESVSEPWHLVHRTDDDATISYVRRPRDLPIDARDIDTGRPAVPPSGRRHIVGVDSQRLVTRCAGQERVRLLLRPEDPHTSSPYRLQHQRAGAVDVPG